MRDKKYYLRKIKFNFYLLFLVKNILFSFVTKQSRENENKK